MPETGPRPLTVAQREQGSAFVLNEDDTTLLARVVERDRTAMRELYERHGSALFAFLLIRCADRTAAEDIMHDTMLDVWRSAARFQGAATVRTWIFSIARNKYIDWRKKTSRLSLVDELPDTPDDTPDPLSVIEASQTAAQVRFCLSTLKPAQRSAIRMSFFDDMPYEEIAQIEGVPTGTIKSRIFHAKQALGYCLHRTRPKDG